MATVGLVKESSLLCKSIFSHKRPTVLRSLCNQLKDESGCPLDKKEIHPKPFSEMPTVKKYPIVGSFLPLFFKKDYDPKRVDRLFYGLVEKYGPIFSIHNKWAPTMVIVTDPDDYETMMRTTLINPVRFAFLALKQVRETHPENFFEKKGGLLTENNEEWWRVRSRVQSSMLKPKNIAKYLPKMDEVSKDFMNVISDLQREHGEMPKNFMDELYKWALESVGLVALNRRLNCLEPNLDENSVQMKLIHTVNDIFDAMHACDMVNPLWRIYPTKHYKNLQRGHQVFLEIADAHIREAEGKIKANSEERNADEMSLMEVLLKVPGLSRKDVVTLIIDMLMAGIDTTAHTIGFTLYLLARNPSAQKKLQEEIDLVVGNSQEPLTEDQISKLTYLRACIKESLRMFPLLLGTSRITQEDIVVSGYIVPKGCLMIGLNALSCKSEEVFARASEFLPERWLRSKPLGKIHPFASLPFSYGRRMCIGKKIAEQEMNTFLVRALQRFDVKYKYEDMDIITRLVTVPSQPLRFEFIDRKK